MYMIYRQLGSTEYDTEHYSGHYSEIPKYAATCPSVNAEFDPESILSHTGTMPIPRKPYGMNLWRNNDL